MILELSSCVVGVYKLRVVDFSYWSFISPVYCASDHEKNKIAEFSCEDTFIKFKM